MATSRGHLATSVRLPALLAAAALLAPPAAAAHDDDHDHQEPPPAPAPGAEPRVHDPQALRREALFDIAVAALAHGDLDTSERAFRDAAAVPGDPVRGAVAASLAERVTRLRVLRLRTEPFAPDEPPPVSRSAGRSEGSHRAAVVGVTTLLGLSVYGWTLPVALDLPDRSPRATIATYMLTSAASFVGPYLLTRERPISAGQGNLVLYGGTRGLWHGLLVSALFLGDVTASQHERAWAASLLLGSAGELAAGYLLADRRHLTAGQARTIGALGDFGFLWGAAAGYFLRLPERPTADQQARGMAATILTGSALGLAGGYFLGRRRDNTWGDGEVLRLSGLVGALIGFGTADAFGVDLNLHDRKVTGLAVAGSALALVAGDRLTRGTDISPAQSVLIDLATVAGGLTAAGLSYLATPVSGDPGDGGGSDPPYVMAAALGAAAGFGLSYWSLHDPPDQAPVVSRSVPPRLPRLGLLPLATPHTRGVSLFGSF